jgi:thiol-disulfide isomerase/thioredoxin
MKSVLPVLVVVMLAASACSSGDGSSPTVVTGEASEVPGRGVAAPGFEGELLSGGSIGLEELRGQPVIVNFWATTCAPCIREMPALAGTADDHADDGLVVLGVNYGESVAQIERFIDGFEVELGFPIMLDNRGEIGRLFKVVVFPTTYFIDRDGVIQYRRLGELGERHLEEGLARIM